MLFLVIFLGGWRSFCWALLGSLMQLQSPSALTGARSLSLADSLERLTGLRKAVMVIVMVYYGERMPIKISKGKRHMGQSPTETSHKLPSISCQCSLLGTCWIPPAVMCDDTCKVLPTRKAHQTLVFCVFTAAPMRLTSATQLPRGQIHTQSPKPQAYINALRQVRPGAQSCLPGARRGLSPFFGVCSFRESRAYWVPSLLHTSNLPVLEDTTVVWGFQGWKWQLQGFLRPSLGRHTVPLLMHCIGGSKPQV